MPRSEAPGSARPGPPRDLRASVQALRGLLPELLRFGAVGVASAGVYFALYWFFGWLSPFPPSVLATLAYGTGMIFNYLVQRSFTFRSQRQHHHAGPRYLVVQLGGLMLNTLVIYLGVDLARWPFLPIQLGAIVLTAMWNYLGQKLWAFDGPRQQG